MTKKTLNKLALVAATFGMYIGTPCKAQDDANSVQKKIDILSKKIHSTNDITTYPMPDSLVNVQNKYIELDNFFIEHTDKLDSLEKDNWNLYLRAYDKVAVRIGKNFQLSKYFKQWELDAIKQMLQKSNDLASYDYVQKNAYARIMNNTASLADLLECHYNIDFDVVEQNFETKFILSGLCDEDINYSFLSPIIFMNKNINKDVNKELMILLDCWAKSYIDKQMFLMDLQSKKAISALTGDNIVQQTKNIKQYYKNVEDKFLKDFIAENGGLNLPNFRIPEMQAIKKTYLQNEKQINQLMDQYDEMYSYEQRLQNFAYQENKRLSDSLSVLIKKQNQHIK